MLNLFKKLLGKSEGQSRPLPRAEVHAVTPRVAPTPQVAPDLLQGMAQVEVANLSLAAILAKLPQELTGMVAQMPDPSITVALPVSTIHKQLASGSVKMSLASLYRQAPAGTFSLRSAEDRRLVEVPLSEVFRHVRPQVLRRKEQRKFAVPDDAVALFGNKENPYAMEPAVPEDSSTNGYRPTIEPEPAPTADRTLRPSDDMRAHSNGAHEDSSSESSPQVADPSPGPAVNHTTPSVSPQRVIQPPAGFAAPEAPIGSVHESGEPPLLVDLAALAQGWPEPIRSEALALDGAKVALPTGPVTAGLAKGKIAFTWGQVRSWLEPATTELAGPRDGTELVLPLKVVAPAFLRRAKPAPARKTFELDESIPALFSGTAAPPEPPPAPEVPADVEAEKPAVAEIPPIPPPVFPDAPVDRQEESAAPEQEEPITPPAPVMLVMPPLEVEPVAEEPKETAEEVPVAAEEPSEPVIKLLAEPPVEKIEEDAVAEEAPCDAKPADPAIQLASTPPPAAIVPAAAAEAPAPKTLGEVLGQPDKAHWSPPELVKATVGFKNVAGAIIALQEGFVVAAELPEHVKADTVAAFLPQIFARLNNYSAEMGLGEVGDLLTTTNGAQLQVHRFGEVYFAILGKTGEVLPWEQIGPVVAELASQHRK